MFFFQNLVDTFYFFSAIFSIILLFGLFQVGELIFLNNNIKIIFQDLSNLNYQKILIASNFLMLIIFPIVLFEKHSKIILYLLSFLLFLIGIYKLLKIFIIYRNYIFRLQGLNLEKFLYFLFFLGFFLISLSPVNHADSLDYHMSGAKYIWEQGRLPLRFENFHYFLLGSGEVLMSIGFIFNAEQFGNLLQFSGLLSLIGILKKNSNGKLFFLLLILSSPVIIFLASTQKPQLLHICSNTFVFVLLFINFEKKYSKGATTTYLIFIINIFLINSVNAKFSFILSSSILYILLTIYCFKNRILLKMFFINTLFLFLFFFSFLYWKYINWGGSIIDYIFNPLPSGIEGIKFFKSYLINYKREEYLLELFIPKNFNEFTNSLGIGSFVFIYLILKKNKFFYFSIPIILLFVFINYFFGQPSARFFVEPYIWLILILYYDINFEINKNIKKLFYIQFFISIGALWYGVLNMSYGSISYNLKDSVMQKTADGYLLFKWANSILDKDSVVISKHRSVFLGHFQTLSTSFESFVNTNSGKLKKYHIQNILNIEKPIYLLSYGDKNNLGVFAKCVDFLFKEKKNVGRLVGRNPLNKGNPYNGYIFKLKNIKDSKCIKYDR